jgi:CDP-glycerol glycerophosphotransferase
VATGRPVVLFTPDLGRYRTSRGLYLDLESQRPGPHVQTSVDAIDVLRTIDRPIDSVAAEHAATYAAFARKYAPHDDGKAAARFVDHVFAG